MNAKKNECIVCGKKVVYVKYIKENGATTHVAYHEDEVPNGVTIIDYNSISATYRNRLRSRMPHVNKPGLPVYDATGMNRIVMVTEVIALMKERGMSDSCATEMRKKMLAKGSNFESNIVDAAPYIKIVRNNKE